MGGLGLGAAFLCHGGPGMFLGTAEPKAAVGGDYKCKSTWSALPAGPAQGQCGELTHRCICVSQANGVS